jgi:hypothetical protein
MAEFNALFACKLIGALVLYLILPITTLTYYRSRRPRRVAEIERTFSILKVDPDYKRAYDTERPGYYLCAVAYASAVLGLGLTVLLFSDEIGLAKQFVPGAADVGGMRFPKAGSLLVMAMAFLGAYLWGLQHVFRRYVLNDLTPSVYYTLSMRMILAAMTALVLFNASAALAGSDGSAPGGVTADIWPSLAFLVGMFPQRGLRWLTDRLPILSSAKDPSAREAPLETIEGIETHDVLRLEELGIDTCYDLATADFVPLALKTPYSARQLIDYIMQAKACVCFGDAMKDLRRHGIRTIADVESLSPEAIDALAKETSATKYGLEQARHFVKTNPEIRRLRDAGQLLSRFWGDDSDPPAPSEHDARADSKDR